MKITDEDIEFFKQAEATIKKGYYPSGSKTITDYKRIFADEIKSGTMKSNLSPKCGGCIKEAVRLTINKIKEMEHKINEQAIEKEDKGT